MKFSCVTMNSQNQQSPSLPSIQAQLSLIGTNYCFVSISSYTFFQPKVGNSYILSFQPKVSNRYIYEDIFCFVFKSSFYFFCCIPICVGKVGHSDSRAPIVSYATHFTIFSKKPLFGILGHSLKLLLGQIFCCFGRRMVLAPTSISRS